MVDILDKDSFLSEGEHAPEHGALADAGGEKMHRGIAVDRMAAKEGVFDSTKKHFLMLGRVGVDDHTLRIEEGGKIAQVLADLVRDFINDRE